MDIDEIRKKTTRFDPVEYIETPEDESAFLADAMETQDANYIAHALGLVARARGMTQIAKQSGLTREALYKSLSPEGDPKLSTILSVMKALGVGLAAVTPEPKAAPAKRTLSRPMTGKLFPAKLKASTLSLHGSRIPATKVTSLSAKKASKARSKSQA